MAAETPADRRELNNPTDVPPPAARPVEGISPTPLGIRPERSPTGRRRPTAAVFALLLAIAALAFTRRDALRERWIEAQSTESLRKLDARSDADSIVHLHYAERLADAGKAAEALQAATRAVESLPQPASLEVQSRILAFAGYAAARAGNKVQAGEWLQRAANTGREDPFLLLGTGILALRTNHPVDAAAALTDAARLAPGRAEVWRRLGEAMMLGAEPERAAAAFRRAGALAPKDPRIHVQLAQALAGAGNRTDARNEFRDAAALAPKDPDIATLPAIAAANAARTEQEYHQAADLLRGALSTFPTRARLRAILGGLHLRFGESEAARRELEACLEQDPRNALGWHNLAAACERIGDRAGANRASAQFYRLVELQSDAARLQIAIRLHPEDAQAYRRLSDLLRSVGRAAEADAILRRAGGPQPDDRAISGGRVEMGLTLPQSDSAAGSHPSGLETQ